MARLARTSGRMAAAAFAGLEDQKLAPVDNQFNHRLVFGPSALSRTPQMERTQMAAYELQDVCHDAVVMGSSFAEDPDIQAAVLAKIKKTPELQALMMNWGVDKEALEVAEIKTQAEELRTELEWQQDLNQDMISHAERLAEERVQLKARVVRLEQTNDTLAQENNRLRSALEQVQSPAPIPQERNDVNVEGPRPIQQRRQRLRGPCQQEARGGAARGDVSGATIVVQMALAFAAVVIALVVAKKIPSGLKFGALVGAVLNAFGSFH